MYTTTPTASTSVLGPGTFYLFYQFFLRNSQKNIAFKNTGVQSGHILKSNDIKNKSMFAEHLDIYSKPFSSCHSSTSLNKKFNFFLCFNIRQEHTSNFRNKGFSHFLMLLYIQELLSRNNYRNQHS